MKRVQDAVGGNEGRIAAFRFAGEFTLLQNLDEVEQGC
jgi:hypothetical protein